MKISAKIKIEFIAGTEIQDALIQAKYLAGWLNISYVHFNFNGIPCSISEKADIDMLIKQYRETHKPESNILIG